MQIIGMIVGIAVAKYVLHLDNLGAIFLVAMIGWFVGYFLSQGAAGSPDNAEEGDNTED